MARILHMKWKTPENIRPKRTNHNTPPLIFHNDNRQSNHSSTLEIDVDVVKSLSRYHFWFDKVHIKRSHRLQEGRYCIMTCPFHFSHCRHLITNYYHVFFSQNQSAITVSLRCPVKSAGITSLMLFVVLVLQLKASQEEVILKICNMLVIEAIDSVVRPRQSVMDTTQRKDA